MPHALTAHVIRYSGIMQALSGRSTREVAAQLMVKLPRMWDLSYREMTGRDTEIVEIRLDTMIYHFDGAVQGADEGDERVVVVYGFSSPSGEERDSSRMRGFPGGGLADPLRGKRDRGHFASHAQGGGLDLNLFSQRPEVNRGRADGWSSRGVSFRRMEMWCVENPGTFFFARPIYLDESWTPHALEYGVLRSPTDLWVERFPN